jgi:preprotein translocase subunit SecE
MFGVWALFLAGAWKFSQTLFDSVPYIGPLVDEQWVRYVIAAVIFGFGMWFGYRLVHYATFADFLISVESEMVKVSWPGVPETRSSTIVVLVMLLLLWIMIWLFDLIWIIVFHPILN